MTSLNSSSGNKWSNLPNAAHIDRVLAHARARPDKWSAAWDEAWSEAWGAARDAALDAARDAAWGAAYTAARDAARDPNWDPNRTAAQGAAWDAARGAAWDATRGACAALVVWDEAGDLLSAPVATVRFLAKEGVHAAMLLLPAVIAMEVENERVE